MIYLDTLWGTANYLLGIPLVALFVTYLLSLKSKAELKKDKLNLEKKLNKANAQLEALGYLLNKNGEYTAKAFEDASKSNAKLENMLSEMGKNNIWEMQDFLIDLNKLKQDDEKELLFFINKVLGCNDIKKVSIFIDNQRNNLIRSGLLGLCYSKIEHIKGNYQAAYDRLVEDLNYKDHHKEQTFTIHYNAGDIALYKLHHYADAFYHLKAAYEIKDDPILYQRMLSLYMSHPYDKKLFKEILDKAVEKYPNNYLIKAHELVYYTHVETNKDTADEIAETLFNMPIGSYEIEIVVQYYDHFAINLNDDNYYKKGIELLKRSVIRFPQNNNLKIMMASFYQRLGDVVLAEEIAISIFDKFDPRQTNIANYIDLLNDLDQLKLAKVLIEKHLNDINEAGDLNIFQKMIFTYYYLGDYANVLKVGANVLAIEYNTYYTHFFMGLAYYQLDRENNLDKSIKHVKITADSEHFFKYDACYNLSQMYFYGSLDYDNAELYTLKALEGDPGNSKLSNILKQIQLEKMKTNAK